MALSLSPPVPFARLCGTVTDRWHPHMDSPNQSFPQRRRASQGFAQGTIRRELLRMNKLEKRRFTRISRVVNILHRKEVPVHSPRIHSFPLLISCDASQPDSACYRQQNSMDVGCCRDTEHLRCLYPWFAGHWLRTWVAKCIATNVTQISKLPLRYVLSYCCLPVIWET